MKLSHISYSNLNSKQRERFNFQKIAGLLADYRFSSIKLDDDWQGADFLAQHIDGETFIKVQLKGRLTFDKKYNGKHIFIAFPYHDEWYLFNHDALRDIFLQTFPNNMADSISWKEKGAYSWGHLSKQILTLLEPYKLIPMANSIPSESNNDHN